MMHPNIQQHGSHRGGFTLIEMIVAIFLFSMVMVIASASLISIVSANRKAQAVKTVMNNLNFTLDSMTRAIRTGSAYGCSGTCNSTNGATDFFFTDTDGRHVWYRYNSGSKSVERSLDNGVTYQPLTSPGLVVSNLKFYVFGQATSDPIQPVVAIVIQGTAGDARAKTSFNLETFVTQRLLDRPTTP